MKNIHSHMDRVISYPMWEIRRYLWMTLYGKRMEERLERRGTSYEVRTFRHLLVNMDHEAYFTIKNLEVWMPAWRKKRT